MRARGWEAPIDPRSAGRADEREVTVDGSVDPRSGRTRVCMTRGVAALREIDRDLRREEELWREIRRDLEELEGPPTARNPGRIVVVVVAVLLLLAAFGLGWNLAPTTTGMTTASALEQMRTANAESIEYADQAMHMSSQIGRLNGELARGRGAPGPDGSVRGGSTNATPTALRSRGRLRQRWARTSPGAAPRFLPSARRA